jgi:hypothetical protein
MSENIVLPPAEEVFLQWPIYKDIDLTYVPYDELIEILFFENSLDCVCPYCIQEGKSIFKSTVRRPEGIKGFSTETQLKMQIMNMSSGRFMVIGEREKYDYKNGYYDLRFKCQRDESHIITFNLTVFKNHLMKIGQFPSVSHIKSSEFEKYKPVIGDENVEELKKAERSYGMHLGVGAFTYLRRIFERIVEKFHGEAKNSPVWSAEKEEKFSNIRLVEKLEMLEDFLPKFVVDNKKTFYAVLSNAVHNMNDKECLENYETAKECLDIILDEMLSNYEKEERERKAKSKLDKLHNSKKI